MPVPKEGLILQVKGKEASDVVPLKRVLLLDGDIGTQILSKKLAPLSTSIVSQLKGMNKGTLWYDKKTGKVRIEYAAFFSKPLDDVQCDLVIYDVTNHVRDRRTSTENFMKRGDRVLFNSITLDKEDFEMNKKYLFVMENRGRTLATGELIIRGEGPHYSGKVEFSDEETKAKH